jgi:RNA polymerase sigma factor (TIGR02999 family)
MTDSTADRTPEDIRPAAELLPGLYEELRKLAAALTAQLRPGQTLQPTALVHEAYLRLVRDRDPGWEGRRHFFGAAARAMREILIEQARRKDSRKRGGGGHRVELTEGLALIEPPAGENAVMLPPGSTRASRERPSRCEPRDAKGSAVISSDVVAADRRQGPGACVGLTRATTAPGRRPAGPGRPGPTAGGRSAPSRRRPAVRGRSRRRPAGR